MTYQVNILLPNNLRGYLLLCFFKQKNTDDWFDWGGSMLNWISTKRLRIYFKRLKTSLCLRIQNKKGHTSYKLSYRLFIWWTNQGKNISSIPKEMLTLKKNRKIYKLGLTGYSNSAFPCWARGNLNWQNKSHLSRSIVVFFSFTPKIEIPKHSWKQQQANWIKMFYTDKKIIQNMTLCQKIYRKKKQIK